jgi:mannose-6-phosphate isomerase-like protein (cupin superfamily)
MKNYTDEAKPWGKIRKYDTEKLELKGVSCWLKIYAEEDHEIDLHSHPETEAFFLERGEVHVQSSAGESYKLSRGQIGQIASSEEHSILVKKGSILNIVKGPSSDALLGLGLPQVMSLSRTEDEN